MSGGTRKVNLEPPPHFLDETHLIYEHVGSWAGLAEGRAASLPVELGAVRNGHQEPSLREDPQATWKKCNA